MGKANETFKERLRKKRRAYFFVIVKGYTQKEAAKLVDVSERTICEWAAKYKWKEIAENKLLRTGGVKALMDDFILFVDIAKPDISQEISELWKAFLTSLKKE